MAGLQRKRKVANICNMGQGFRISKLTNNASTAKGFSLTEHLHILIVGASGRFLAASALAAGYVVSVADLFGDFDTRLICEQSGKFRLIKDRRSTPKSLKIESLKCLSKRGGELTSENRTQFFELESLGADVVIFAGGAENHPEFFGSQFLTPAYIAGPSATSIERLLSSKAINQACKDHSIRRPLTICSSVQTNLIEELNKDWLQKQIRSGGGLQTRRWDGVAAIDFSKGDYLQEFVDGETVSGCYICSRHKDRTKTDRTKTRLLGACVQQTNFAKNDFRYRGSVGPMILLEEEYHEMARVGRCIAEAFKLVGVFGIDFIRGSQGICMIDINPRVPASAELIERSRRKYDPTFTIVGAHLAASMQHQLPTPAEISNEYLNSKTIIYLPANRQLKVDVGLVDYFQNQSYISDVPMLGSKIEANHPLVTVHAEAGDAEALKVKSDQRIAELWQRLEPHLESV